jgi:hypothetical protein
MARSTEELAHLEWLGYVQPVGLVVSIPALLEAQCHVNRNIMGLHGRFLECLPRDAKGELLPELRDLWALTQRVLDWRASDLVPVPPRGELPESMRNLEVVLPHYDETLRPSFAVPHPRPAEGQSPWQMLVTQLDGPQPLDEESAPDSGRHWNATPQAKFERLLRETGIPVGLLCNSRALRLVYAPRGESSGYATFPIAEMTQVAGRPIFAALQMLLSQERLFALGDKERLPGILENSRKYQNLVSTALAEQVLAALYELMRGFQAANDATAGKLLASQLEENPNQVYAGLLTVLMRLVFVLYAEDRNLLSSDPVYSNHYSVTGLFDRLRSDAGRHPDTMDQRYGAWAQLLTLFRLIYEGGQHGAFQLPARKGYLFDPDRYPFLEGRNGEERHGIPRISDGVVFRVLQDLLILDGERLSYRALDVEQIGSVYETVMGFNLETAEGQSIAIRPAKAHGAPTTINLDELLATEKSKRAKWFEDTSGQKATATEKEKLKEAKDVEELLVALDKKIMKSVTPQVVPAGAIVLQPSDERRRSGSHYTPRSLTAPIVETTLEPILQRLCDPAVELPAVYAPTPADRKRYTEGQIAERMRLSERAIEYARRAREVGVPHPQQILDLKVCDPAMGSGAFLVETCRFLGDELIKSWYAHYKRTDAGEGESFPVIPPDEDEVLYARRLVAQRCLYGVDKNEMAVDLAKLSLWLVTLAKDHAFTFLDHSLRHGDSLVGLTRQQIIGFHWEPTQQRRLGDDLIQRRLDRATEERVKILNAREDVAYRDQEQRLVLANDSLEVIRLTGDACVSAFLSAAKDKEREARCNQLFLDVAQHFQNLKDGKVEPEVRARLQQAADSLRTGEHPIPPFHWDIEFPEVFSRENGGFDAFVGNPPFAGKNTLLAGNRASYLDWLKKVHDQTHGNSDLVAHFFRRAFSLVRAFGTTGLITTNTISQGDTRSTGLRWICINGGGIYSAKRRIRWPGQAAVVVSIVWIFKGEIKTQFFLDDLPVKKITAFLVESGSSEDPFKLSENSSKCFKGCDIYGLGFTFDDRAGPEVANPTSLMHELIKKSPRNKEVIFPFIGGEEVNEDPSHRHHRYVINFGTRSLEDARHWPELLRIVELRVKPERLKLKNTADGKRLKEKWWLFSRSRPELTAELQKQSRALVISQVTARFGLAFLPSDMVFSHKLCIFPTATLDFFACLQSRIHECWARFFSATLKDDLSYSPADCFDNFPVVSNPDSRPMLGKIGEDYYEFRSGLMVRNNEGLTKTYNRFHDPQETSPDILKLRQLHAEMDRAVLEAYGWRDLAARARCEFLLDYEEEENEDEPSGKGKGGKGKKKPWRLRWPDEFRDEVLARLLELNEQRHKEELAAGIALTSSSSDDEAADSDEDSDPDAGPSADSPATPPPAPRTPTRRRARPSRRPNPGQGELLGE